MAERSGAFKAGSVLWALLMGGLVIVVGGSILLPSTKRSRLSPERLRQLDEQERREEAAAAAEAAAATAPSTVPTTEPAVEQTAEPISRPAPERPPELP